jgi:divalent metal cation (Fe/Co/Zn/Cd) transporter
VLVSLFIIYTGGKYALETISRLLGEAPSPDEVEKIRGLARDQEGVRGVHDIMVHKYGDMRVISLHIEVDADWSVLDVHELSEQVEDKLERNIPQCKAIVHVDPVDRSHVRYDRLQELMTEFARQHPCMMEFHDLRVDGARDALRMSVDVVLKPETSEAAYAHVRGQLERYLAQHCPSMQHAEISIEPSYHGGTNAGN